MADKNRYNLLYEPDLKPERNYRSEAVFPPPEPTPAVETNVPVNPTLPEIIEDLKTLEDLAGGLPEGLKPVEEIVSILRQRAEVIQIEQTLLEEIPPDPIIGPEPETIVPVTESIPEELKIGTNVLETIPEIPGIPQMFPPPSHVKINVQAPKTLVQLTQDAYTKDQIDLQKYYLQNMRLILQKYFQNQFALIGELGISEVDILTREYYGDNVTGVGTNSQHLHDTVIRSQLARKQKAKYFSKVANTEQTLLHMRNWNAAEKLRERYYGEAYGEADKFTNSEANAILRQNRSEYDANYKANLYNMYKYLDGSLKMTEDILDHTLLESKAKAKLMKDGVNIFAQPSYATGSGVSTTQAEDSKTVKAKEEAAKKAAAESQENKKLTPEEVDKAMKIEDPADEAIYGLAPNGGHFSQNDVNYLISENPEIYGTSGQKAINVANTLALNSKYMAASESKNDSNSNKSTENRTETVANNSQEKVEKVVGTESTSTSSDSNTTTTNSSYTSDPYYWDLEFENSQTTNKQNIISGSGFWARIYKRYDYSGNHWVQAVITNESNGAIVMNLVRYKNTTTSLDTVYDSYLEKNNGNSVILSRSDFTKVYNKIMSISL